jgi:dTDP-4-dehydrorhamnose reductase
LCRQLGHDAVPLGRRELDVTDAAEVRRVLAELRPRAVINSAAYTSVDAAERDPAACWAVNSQGVQHLAEACCRSGSTLVQISSDYVFGADRERDQPYSETDVPGPENVYASSKLGGEYWAQTCPRHLIIRTCGLYGHAPRARNFVTTLLRLSDDPQTRLRVVNDQHCTPSYVRDVAKAILFLLDSDQHGTFHVVNGGATTWFSFACEMFRLAGKAVPLEPISTEQYGAPAERPRYSVLDTQKYRSLGGPELPQWQNALADFLRASAPPPTDREALPRIGSAERCVSRLDSGSEERTAVVDSKNSYPIRLPAFCKKAAKASSGQAIGRST